MPIPEILPIGALAAGGHEKRERVQSAISGLSVDRPPVCFWNHFHPNGSGGNMALDTIDFYARRHDLDIAKVMSDIPYPMPRLAVGQTVDWQMVIDWGSADNSFTRSYVSAVRQVRAVLGPAYPLVVTIYSPTTWAMLFSDPYTVRQRFLDDLARRPSLVHGALANIALNLRRVATACIEAGADGIFLSAHGCDPSLPLPIYKEISRPYELMVLQGAQDGWLNLIHAHSDDPEIYLDEFLDYPVKAISWADVKTGRRIAEMRAKTTMGLMGGWDRTEPLLVDQTASMETLIARFVEDGRKALAEAGGKGLIMAPGCSLPAQVTPLALAAYRQAVEQL